MTALFLNDAAIAGRQLRFEQKAFWRNPAGAVFTFAFPLLFLVIFSTLNSGMRIEERGNKYIEENPDVEQR